MYSSEKKMIPTLEISIQVGKSSIPVICYSVINLNIIKCSPLLYRTPVLTQTRQEDPFPKWFTQWLANCQNSPWDCLSFLIAEWLNFKTEYSKRHKVKAVSSLRTWPRNWHITFTISYWSRRHRSDQIQREGTEISPLYGRNIEVFAVIFNHHKLTQTCGKIFYL